MIASGPTRSVAVYARVSTARQFEADLSIPDQIRHAEDYCARRGWVLAERFIEQGASGTDEKRPILQHMIDVATRPGRTFDAILVHSMSRFFRNQYHSEFHRRKLERAGVELISMTQEFTADATGHMLRQMLGAFDEYQSREMGKHTLRAMIENARQSYWNGSRTPFGYRAVEVERRGNKVKKRLVLDEVEAPVVRRIFDFALGRDGLQRGVKAIVSYLNQTGERFRGKLFHISNVHRILTSPTYAGVHIFNRKSSRTQQIKPKEEWVYTEVPTIISPEAFELVLTSLAARNPKRTPPRVVSGPTLLTGLAICASCGSGMTMRTGKGGKYRYYACAGAAQKGKSKCPGRAVSMPALDEAVTTTLAERLFTEARLTTLLNAMMDRSAAAEAARVERLSQAKRALTEADGRVTRLLQLYESGAMEIDDPLFRERLTAAKDSRRSAQEELEMAKAATATGNPSITPAKIKKLAEAMNARMRNADPALRKAYLQLFVGHVIVADGEIRIGGPTAAIERAAAELGQSATPAMVPSFVREWYPVRDSNSCYRREREVEWDGGGRFRTKNTKYFQ